jgi:hypothetical protein
MMSSYDDNEGSTLPPASDTPPAPADIPAAESRAEEPRRIRSTDTAADATASHTAAKPVPALAVAAKIVVIPLRARSGVDADTALLLTGILLSELQGVGNMQTISATDVEAVLGLERQKDMLGCNGVSCAAEIGGALGADLVMYGEIGSLGGSFALNLNALRPRDTTVVARLSRVTSPDEGSIVQAIRELVVNLVEQLNR